jgi:riboflavin transporter FmnP
MRAEALKLFRKLFLNKYARVINYFGLLCHTEILVFLEIEYFRTFRTFESTKVLPYNIRRYTTRTVTVGPTYIISTVLPEALP